MSALKDKHKQYDEYLSRWELCKDLFEGEHEIHEKGETYLPKLQDESDKAYQARLRMTPVFGALPRTTLGMRGMMFRKPMKIEVPDALLPMLEDIDLAGTTLQGLAQEVVEDALVVGRVGLLVDYPQTMPNATKADAGTLNYRPMIVKYEAEAIYNWRTERINGATVLSQVRLEEEKEIQDPEDEFKYKCEKRYRILDLIEGKYRQRVYKIIDNEEVLEDEIYPTMNGKNLPFIPFVVIGVDCIGIEVEAPPLIDLATTVLHHYQQATSYERGCFFSGLPMFNIFGVNPSNEDGTPLEISIGGNIANIFPRSDAHAEMLEVTSKFEALRTNLEDKKREMAVLGARMLESQKAGVEAADTIARRMSGEESLLSIMAQTVSSGLTQPLRWFSEWAGVTGDVSVELNRDFMPAGITAQDMTALIGAWQQGAVSSETLFSNLKAGEIIADDVTFEEEQERIAGTLPGLTPPMEQPPSIDEATISDMIAQAINAATADIMQKMETMQPAPQAMDMQQHMQGISDAIAAMPVPIVNVAPATAPTINVSAPTITLPEQQAPIVNVAPAAVTVEGSTINMPDQPITVNVPEQPQANVTINNLPPEGKRAIVIQRDNSGKITGGITEELEQ